MSYIWFRSLYFLVFIAFYFEWKSLFLSWFAFRWYCPYLYYLFWRQWLCVWIIIVVLSRCAFIFTHRCICHSYFNIKYFFLCKVKAKRTILYYIIYIYIYDNQNNQLLLCRWIAHSILHCYSNTFLVTHQNCIRLFFPRHFLVAGVLFQLICLLLTVCYAYVNTNNVLIFQISIKRCVIFVYSVFIGFVKFSFNILACSRNRNIKFSFETINLSLNIHLILRQFSFSL